MDWLTLDGTLMLRMAACTAAARACASTSRFCQPRHRTLPAGDGEQSGGKGELAIRFRAAPLVDAARK
eukprot:789227-Prymnesium_polylepis.1